MCRHVCVRTSKSEIPCARTVASTSCDEAPADTPMTPEARVSTVGELSMSEHVDSYVACCVSP